MSFLSPLFLLLAGLTFLVLKFHVHEHRQHQVPSLLIWKRLRNAGKGSSHTRKWPRPSLPLILQLLIVLAVALALAQPLWGANRAVAHWIYVLDNSASIQAGADGVSHRDLALAQLHDSLARDANGARYSLIAAGDTALPVFARQHFSLDGFSNAIDSIVPQDGRADWDGVKTTIKALLRPDELTHLVTLSDDMVPLDLTGPALERTDHRVGTALPNAGLTAALAPLGSDGTRWTLSGLVTFSSGMNQAKIAVTLLPNGAAEAVEVGSITIDNAHPGEPETPTPFIRELTLQAAGLVTLALAEDAAAFDNTVYLATLAEPSRLDVLHIGPDDQPLVRALGAVDGVTVHTADTLPDDADTYDLIVADNVILPRQPKTNVLLIGNARLADDPIFIPLEEATPTGWHANHPLSRDVAWSQLNIANALQLTPEADADRVLLAGAAPLITAWTGPFGREVRLAFDPRDSNWPEQAGPAIFATNLVQWLGPLPGQLIEPTCVAGSPCNIDVRLVGGVAQRLDQSAAPTAITAASFVPMTAGLYQLERDGRVQRLIINPMGGAESQLANTAPPADAAMPEQPLALRPFLLGLVLALLLAETGLAWFGPRRRLSARQGGLLALRGAALLTIVLALVDVPLLVHRTDQAVIALVGSAGPAELDGLLAQTAGAQLGVVSIAGPARIALDRDGTRQTDTADDLSSDGLAGLHLAAALLPLDSPGRLLVATTGHQTADALAGFAAEMQARATAVDGVAPQSGDVLAQSLSSVTPVYAGDSFTLTGIVNAPAPMAAIVTISRGTIELSRQNIQLQAGANRIDTPIIDVEPGTALYEMAVLADGDPELGNNRIGAMILAQPTGTIAIVAAEPAQGRAFAQALASQGLDAAVIDPANAPDAAAGWLAYSGAVLMNVPAIALTTRQQEQLEMAVANQGLGLLLLGGANSFGPGGYLETALDRVSPISSRVPRDKPRVALAFVLDRSSSMKQMVGTVTRLDVAKQATLSAIRLMNEESKVSVITFDSRAQLVLPLRPVTETAAITKAVNQIGPGGGTAMYRGLAEAFSQLQGVDASARHIVIMTDGLSQPADFPGLITQIRAADITISSVAIGSESEIDLVKQVAELGGGAFHATEDFGALPSILSQEAMLQLDSAIEATTTTPYWVNRDAPFLADLAEAVPPIDGFVLATPKPDATLLMMADDAKGEAMPLMAHWRYGNGQVLALTTDAAGEWSRAWQQQPDYPLLWAQALRQFLPSTARSGLTLTTERLGDTAVLRLTGAFGSAPTLTATTTNDIAVPLALRETAPGQFTAQFTPPTPGTLRLQAAWQGETATAATHLSYPARLDWSLPDRGGQLLAMATGGVIIAADSPYLVPSADRWTTQSVWPLWAGLALLAVMLELTGRYTQFFNRLARRFAVRRPKPQPA